MVKDKVKDPAEYSVEDKLRSLYALQVTLSQIDGVRRERGELPLEVQDLEDEIEGLTTRIENINNRILELQADIAERAKAMEENKAAIARYTEQQDNVRNNREFDLLKKQIEYAVLDNQSHEQKIDEEKTQVDAKSAEVAEANKRVVERRTDLDLKKSALDEIMAKTKADEETLLKKADELEQLIEPRLLLAFKRIRKNCRNGLGVVYVDRDACGGCFNKIPPQRQLDIRMRKKIIVCEYCGRIMVDRELAGVTAEAPKAEPKKKSARSRAAKRKAEE